MIILVRSIRHVSFSSRCSNKCQPHSTNKTAERTKCQWLAQSIEVSQSSCMKIKALPLLLSLKLARRSNRARKKTCVLTVWRRPSPHPRNDLMTGTVLSTISKKMTTTRTLQASNSHLLHSTICCTEMLWRVPFVIRKFKNSLGPKVAHSNLKSISRIRAILNLKKTESGVWSAPNVSTNTRFNNRLEIKKSNASSTKVSSILSALLSRIYLQLKTSWAVATVRAKRDPVAILASIAV